MSYCSSNVPIKDFSLSAALCFTEMHLAATTLDSALCLLGFHLQEWIVSLRSPRGGGIGFYINEGWYQCHSVEDVLLPIPGIHLYYLQAILFTAGFCSVIFVGVCIPPQAIWGFAPPGWWDNHDNCRAKNHPGSVVIIFVDLNRAQLSCNLAKMQYTALLLYYWRMPNTLFAILWTLPGSIYCSIQTTTIALQRNVLGMEKTEYRPVLTALTGVFLNTQAPVSSPTIQIVFEGTFLPSLSAWNEKPTLDIYVRKAQQSMYFLQLLKMFNLPKDLFPSRARKRTLKHNRQHFVLRSWYFKFLPPAGWPRKRHFGSLTDWLPFWNAHMQGVKPTSNLTDLSYQAVNDCRDILWYTFIYCVIFF